MTSRSAFRTDASPPPYGEGLVVEGTAPPTEGTTP
jgi:hypothetical protein